METFTHLHLHTSYSLLDGAIRIHELMEYVKQNGMNAVAMTDHGNMFGAIEFYKTAKKAGVKPIIGLEFYVAPGSRFETKQMENLADGNNYHLILLAKNNKGYQNLIKLASRSYSEGFYRKPRIDYELLAAHSEGLICLSACIAGEIPRKIIAGRNEEALELAGRLNEMFGQGNFFLEIQNHGIPEEKISAQGMVNISRKTGIPLVLTNDAHFLKKEDRQSQDILLRINQKKTLEDVLSFGFTDDFFVKPPSEMLQLFPELPEAFHNTNLIADMVDLDFKFGNPLLPKFDVPQGYTLDSYMRDLAWNGLKKRYGENLPSEVTERFEFEYNVITGMDFPGYFLIVQDFINWAKSTGIPVGPGRGSAAGSIVAYGLGITDIDPLKYDLLFERFLNPDRKEMPDIDVDFCTERREEVINYVKDKYGHDQVGQIITYGTLAAKACLKDVARVMNIPFEEANGISKKFPDGLNITIEDALKQSRELAEYASSGPVQKNLFSVALKLEGNVRHTGVHAAGVVIAPGRLEEYVPMATVAAKGSDKKQDRILVTQYDMNVLSDVGLVKMDFLGLRNLTIINDACKEIERRRGIRVDFDSLDLNDTKSYQLLQKGDVAGVFQLESSGMREFVLRTKPERFEDLIALIALYRPGPLDSGMAESYINRKNGREKVSYPHEDLREILQDTYGVIVYQEQVMLISRIIGGFTPGESDALRKAMGKKIVDKMAEMRVKFVEGAVKKGYNQKFAEEIYDQMAEFAKYGFNKSHSAAYAMIVYRTAYLKANYPVEYMKAVLDSEIDRTERLVFYINSCREMNIKILGPDVNESGLHFTITDDDTIRFGLTAIKNVGEPAARSILDARAACGGKFASILELLENADLRVCNRRALEALIAGGSFLTLGYTRLALNESLDTLLNQAAQSRKDKESGQESLFGLFASDAGGTGASDPDPVPKGEHVAEYPEQEVLQREKEVLGFYLTGHPLKKYEKDLKRSKSINILAIKERSDIDRIELAAVITEISVRQSKAGKDMARVRLEDLSGSIDAMIFQSVLEKVKPMLRMDVPLLFKGNVKKKEDTDTAELIISDVETLNQEKIEEKLEKAIHVKLDRSLADETVTQTLLKIFSENKGNLSVFFHLNGGSDLQVIRAHDSFRVNYSKEMVQRIKSIPAVKEMFLSSGDQIRSL